MKLSILLLAIFCFQFARANCYGPQVSRDAVRAIAQINRPTSFSDIVGGCSANLSCQIYANYRAQGFSDEYLVSFEQNTCQILKVQLIQSGGNLQDPR